MMIAWETYHQELTGFIQRRIQNPMDAEDVLQEVLFKAYRKQAQVLDEQKFRAWVYQIARNTIIDYYRQHSWNLLPLEDGDIVLQPDETDEEAALRHCLVGMVEALPEKYRSAVVAADLHELPQHLLSDQFSMSYSGLKSRVQRGREKLRELLEEACQVEVNQYREIHCQPRSQTCCV